MIGLDRRPGHADVGLRLDVEERLGAGRVVEIDGAARDAIAPAFEIHVAALDVRMPRDHRPVVRALKRQVRTGDETQQVRVDPQRRGHFDSHVVAEREGRRRLADEGRSAGRRAAREIENAPGRLDAPRPQRALHHYRPIQRRRLEGAHEREIGVEGGTDPFEQAQLHVLAADRDIEIRGLVAVKPDAAADLDLPSSHRRRHIVEPDASGVEGEGAVDRIEGVWQREVTDAALGNRRAAGAQTVRGARTAEALGEGDRKLAARCRRRVHRLVDG